MSDCNCSASRVGHGEKIGHAPFCPLYVAPASDQVWLSKREHVAMEAVIEQADKLSDSMSLDQISKQLHLLGRRLVELRTLRAELLVPVSMISAGVGTTEFGGDGAPGVTVLWCGDSAQHEAHVWAEHECGGVDEFGTHIEREDPDYWRSRRPVGDQRFFDPSPE